MENETTATFTVHVTCLDAEHRVVYPYSVWEVDGEAAEQFIHDSYRDAAEQIGHGDIRVRVTITETV